MEKIWWEHVPGALAFSNKIFGAISNEQNIVLASKNGLPWRDHLCNAIKERFRLSLESKRIEELYNISTPGEYLLKKYCKPEKRAEYRPSRSFANFFANSEDIVFHDRLFWVRLTENSSLNEWMTFISDYTKERGNDKKQATFLVECIVDKSIGNKKGINVVSFDEYISDYDRFVFCLLAASSVNESVNIKKYLSELISNVIGNNVEFCEKIVADYSSFLANPFAYITRTMGAQLQTKESLSTFSKTEATVIHDVWLSQVRIVYPILEDYRERFVKKHWKDISKNLPLSSSNGEIYRVPEDVELGKLRYLADNQKINTTANELTELILHTQARNDLSHLKILDISNVRKILK